MSPCRRHRQQLPTKSCCKCCFFRRHIWMNRFPPILVVLTFAMFAALTQHPVTAFQPKPSISQEMGCSPTLSVFLRRDNEEFYYFDPLGIATTDNFARLRESELKAGRVAMAALAQTITIPILHKLFTNPNNLLRSILSFLGKDGAALRRHLLSMNGGITTNKLSFDDAFKVVGVCLVLEFILVMPETSSMPGDYGVGWFGTRDKSKHERELVCELEHCRLAMLAFALQLALELQSGVPWEKRW